MICFAKDKHISEITALWTEAFGDSAEDVRIYLETLLKYCAVYEENGSVSGMLFMLPLELCGKCGRYIYAAATFKKCRGRGIMTEMLDFAKAFIKNGGESFLLLVPQNEGLFEFYEKRGFMRAVRLKKESADFKNAENDAEILKLSADEYFSERKNVISVSNFVEWSAEMLDFAEKMYGGEFLKLTHKDGKSAAAFAVKFGSEVVLKEILSQNPSGDATLIKKYLGAEKVSFVYPENDGNYFAMTYPEIGGDLYFNIALD